MNVPKLRAKITEKQINRKDLCTLWGFDSVTTVSNKVNGKTPMLLDEAQKFSEYAGLSDSEKVEIFFTSE